MTDLRPKKVVSEEGTEREAGRQDAYQLTEGFDRAIVDDYIEKRDTKVKEVEQAEEDLDVILKRVRGKDVGPTSQGD